jgi:hypothetical protein
MDEKGPAAEYLVLFGEKKQPKEMLITGKLKSKIRILELYYLRKCSKMMRENGMKSEIG